MTGVNLMSPSYIVDDVLMLGAELVGTLQERRRGFCLKGDAMTHRKCSEISGAAWWIRGVY